MDINDLTDDQISQLTPEQIETLENDPGKLDEILAANGKPEQAVKDSAANGAGKEARDGVDGVDAKKGDETGIDEEPVVLNKSGKGVIPYSAHKELRVENSTLREQNEQMREQLAKLQELQQAKADAPDAEAVEVAEEAIQAHLSILKDDMPELHQVLSSVVSQNRKQGEQLQKTLAELQKMQEEAQRRQQMTDQEQVIEALENNPDLLHWEKHDRAAWDEAQRQDQLLEITPEWAKRPYEERFAEAVRRVRAIMPDASTPSTQTNAERTRARANERLQSATARKPTTLSDIHGGADPASEREQFENLDPFELTQRLMKMPETRAAAMRAGLE